MIESADLDQARREGYQRGLAVGLFWIASFCAVYAAAWPAVETPRFRSIFEQVKVPMPGLTMLVMDYHGVMAAGLLMGIAACAFVNFHRKPKAYLFNGLLLVLALSWTTVSALAIKLPFYSLMQGIGRGR